MKTFSVGYRERKASLFVVDCVCFTVVLAVFTLSLVGIGGVLCILCT